jgi:hypothetical protein
MSALGRWLAWPGQIIWRWFTGKPLDGVPSTDATWLARGTAPLDRATVPRPPRSLREEIRGDVAAVREEGELWRRARRVRAEWDAEREAGE